MDAYTRHTGQCDGDTVRIKMIDGKITMTCPTCGWGEVVQP